MKQLLAFFLFFSTIPFCLSQSPGFRIDYYTPNDYGKGREAVNYSPVQDRNGVLYFGNAGGVLKYDGFSWSFIPVKNQSLWISALVVSNENVVYVGAQNEFGYLEPSESGKLTYVSISDQISKDFSFPNINRLWASENRIFFQYEEALFIWSEGVLKTILPETSFHISSLLNNELYLRQRGTGIMKLKDDSLQMVKGSEILKESGVFSILESTDKNRLYFVTHENGIWYLDKNTSKCSLLKTDERIIYNYGALWLTDGKIAISTRTNGIIITDENFKFLYAINKNNGLKLNGVLSLMQDYQGNLWACLDNGIAQIHYSSPVSFYGPESGISGNINAITRYNGNLYFGTTDGLFIMNEKSGPLSDAFIPLRGISKDVRSFCHAEESLLINTGDELYCIKQNEVKKIETIDINSVHYSEKLRMLFLSGRKKFFLYKYSGTWNKIAEIPEITEEIVRIEESAVNENITLWMGTRTDGIVRLQIKDYSHYQVDKYNSADGLTDNTWVLPFRINNKILFSQADGLLTFIDEITIHKQLPDSLKNRSGFYKGYFDFTGIDSLSDIIRKPIYFAEDTRKRVYVNYDGDLGYFDKGNAYSFVKEPFVLSYIGKINFILHEDNGVCWIGGNDGLLRFNEEGFKDYSLDFRVLITSVTCGTDSVLSYGLVSDNKYDIKYALNTVTFDFAAPFLEGQENTVYSYMLTGQDTSYSNWNRDNRIAFNNLREGAYTFSVKAMNVYGHVSNVQDFSFTVLSPWYRTIWAYIFYLILVSVFIYAGILINSRRLISLNKKLEKTIRDRTQEIHFKNVKLESQQKEILDSINYAHRIQNAILPNDELIKEHLGDHFILFRPKDIVSGDFYWAKNMNQYTVFCVADCTGHGVPGAFMSMLCISLLNEVIIKEKIVHPDTVLNKIRKMVIESLKQKGAMNEQKDGMDISICFYNRETSVIEFAGANNPVYIVRDKDKEPIPCQAASGNEKYILYEIKGDKMPVSIYDKMDPFMRHSFRVQKDDRLYLFSDGICDQSGGPAGRRFMNNSLKAAILDTITPEIRDQKTHIEIKIDEWQSFINPRTGHSYEQVDDICLMGVKL